jgi:hypothetical protein
MTATLAPAAPRHSARSTEEVDLIPHPTVQQWVNECVDLCQLEPATCPSNDFST